MQGIYFKPAPGELVQVGSLSAQERPPAVDPDRYDEAANAAWLPLVRQRLSRRYPAMHRSYGRGGFGSLRALTPDEHPILDRWPGVEGAFLAVGFGNHGFRLAPVVGPLVAEMIVDGQAKGLDMAATALARFEENELLKTAHPYGVVG